ncbi:unnamed protein product, partial [Rotaria socialis]
MKLSSTRTSNNINHHLIESKENNYRTSTATTILNILKNEYGFHPGIKPIEKSSISIQVNLLNRIEKIEQSTQTDQINLPLVSYSKKCLIFKLQSMSSSIVTNPSSECESSSSTSNCYDELTIRRAMHQFLSCVNNSDSSLPVDDNVHSSVSSSLVLHPSLSYKNNQAKFTNDLLIEW